MLVVPRLQAGGRRSAFTLVELLVVISIIALLIAILLPSLKKARENAKRVKCSAHIRGIAQASLTYASEDSSENAIPVNGGHAGEGANGEPTAIKTYYGFGGKAGKGGGGAVQHNIRQSIWGPSGGMEPAKRPLNKILYKTIPTASARPGPGGVKWEPLTQLNFDIYHCPGDKGFSGMHQQGWKDSGLSSYDHFGTSYACNPLWIWQPPDTRLLSNAMYLRPLSRVPTAQNTVMYWENAARYAPFADWPQRPGGQTPANCRPFFSQLNGKPYIAKGFHSTPWKFEVAFGDGHAAYINIRSYGVALGNRLHPDCGANGGQTCICVVVRDTEWQLDTLPAGFILSENHRTQTGGGTVQGSSSSDSAFSVIP